MDCAFIDLLALHAVPFLLGLFCYSIIGGMWYSESMFLPIFLTGNHKKKDEYLEHSPFMYFLVFFFGSLEVIGVLGVLNYVNANTICESVLAVYYIWQFFYVPAICIHFVFDGRSVALMLVNLSYSFAILTSVAITRTFWIFYL